MLAHLNVIELEYSWDALLDARILLGGLRMIAVSPSFLDLMWYQPFCRALPEDTQTICEFASTSSKSPDTHLQFMQLRHLHEPTDAYPLSFTQFNLRFHCVT